jgi:hypothetical protein
MTEFEKYWRVLRSLHFHKTYRSDGGGCRIDDWQSNHSTDGRRLAVQIWADGRHRVTHSIRGCESTVPTEFGSIEELRTAVIREMTRTDNRLLQRGEPT